jgi:hypothetical protein
MDRVKVTGALNRVVDVLSRSLPVYLEQTSPWVGPGAEEARTLLANVASQQRRFAQRMADALRAEGGQVQVGGFPTEFTTANDLCAKFLVEKVLGCQRRDVAAIQRAVDDLKETPWLQVLAQDVLAGVKEQLESLEAFASGRRTR